MVLIRARRIDAVLNGWRTREWLEKIVKERGQKALDEEEDFEVENPVR